MGNNNDKKPTSTTHYHNHLVGGASTISSNRRMFGEFRCPKCRRVWMSANAWQNMGQECQNCKINVYPYILRPLENSGDANKSDPTKAHPQHLCEKCKKLGRYCGWNFY